MKCSQQNRRKTCASAELQNSSHGLAAKQLTPASPESIMRLGALWTLPIDLLEGHAVIAKDKVPQQRIAPSQSRLAPDMAGILHPACYKQSQMTEACGSFASDPSEFRKKPRVAT